jgi:hypothetical protein
MAKQYWGKHLWSRGYCVSTVGLNEQQIKKYVKWQQVQPQDSVVMRLLPNYASSEVVRAVWVGHKAMERF